MFVHTHVFVHVRMCVYIDICTHWDNTPFRAWPLSLVGSRTSLGAPAALESQQDASWVHGGGLFRMGTL